MGVAEAIDPAPSPCPSPVPGGYRLPRSSSYSPLQGRAGAELDLGAAAGGVLEGGGTAAERRTPLVDLFCETCSRPWLIGWWDQVWLGLLGGPVVGHLGYLCGQISYQVNSEFGFYYLFYNCSFSGVTTVVESHLSDDGNCYIPHIMFMS